MKKASSARSLNSALSYIGRLGSFGMNFDLSRMDRLMSAFGHPQNTFPSIHVAGTNGKGSVSAMMANACIKSGLKTGLTTSPHLIDINERFQINGRPIPSDDFIRLTQSLRQVLSSGKTGVKRITQFEFLTALAFLYFSENLVDVAVVEVGLGGRLDATNILKNVAASVITTIALDHTQWLGNSISKIAGEKAGIIKPGIPTVTGAVGAAHQVIQKVCKKRGSRLISVRGSDIKKVAKLTGQLRLKGAHQKLNAAVAFKTLKTVQSDNFSITNSSIIQGIKTARWPGRFEEIQVRRSGRKQKVILDGAHNPNAAQVLVETLRDQGIQKVDLLFGVLKDKDVAGISQNLAPVVDRGVVVPVLSSRSSRPQQVAKLPEWQGKMKPVKNFVSGFNHLLSRGGQNPILISGSLYLVGQARKYLEKFL